LKLKKVHTNNPQHPGLTEKSLKFCYFILWTIMTRHRVTVRSFLLPNYFNYPELNSPSEFTAQSTNLTVCMLLKSQEWHADCWQLWNFIVDQMKFTRFFKSNNIHNKVLIFCEIGQGWVNFFAIFSLICGDLHVWISK